MAIKPFERLSWNRLFLGNMSLPSKRYVGGKFPGIPILMNNTLTPPANPYSQAAFSRPGDSPVLLPNVQRSTVGLVMPRGNMSLAFKVQIDRQGNIYQPVLDGFQRIGQVDQYGNYQFQNGLSGDIGSIR